MRRRLAAGFKRQKPADRDHQRIGARTDRRRDAERHFRTQRKPAAWKFLSCLVPEHLRKPRMGTPSHQGPYRVPKSTAHSGLAMDGTRLREQFRRAAHEYLLLPTHSRKPCPEF